MKITSLEMNMSAVESFQYPKDGLRQVALAGRSNVGKSSLINAILNRKSFARVSQTPGKTRTVNFYKVNQLFYIVDLPGYGYARVAKQEKEKWGKMIEDYFFRSDDLIHMFLLVDIRHDMKEDDIMMVNFARHYGLSFTVVATKADKIGNNEKAKRVRAIRTVCNIDADEVIVFSSSKKSGVTEFWARLSEIMAEHGVQLMEESDG